MTDTEVLRRRSQGPRQARRARKRRQRKRRSMLGVVAAALLIGGVTAGSTWLLTGGAPLPGVGADREDAATVAAGQDTFLLVREAAEGGMAAGATLLAAGPEDAPALVMFVPVGTLLEVPGMGLDRLGQAQQYGGGALVEAALENALGIDIDHVATVGQSGLAAFLSRTDGLAVTVPQRLIERDDEGSAAVRFEPGDQHLDGARLAELWAFQGREEDELATFPRQQQIWNALLAAIADDPGVLAALVGDGAPQLDSAADGEWLAGLLGELASARQEEQLAFTLLPVEPFGGEGRDGSATYRLRDEETAALVAARLGGSIPPEGAGEPVRIQVLNGVGVPGVGQVVDRRLEGGGFRIVLTDNARSFDFDETQILVYDESEASLAAAQRVREGLGVGTIQVSRQPQSVVDLTIVVGADLLDADGQAS